MLAGSTGDFRLFRLTPDIWEPAKVCAVRELARTREEFDEYKTLVQALASDPVIGGRLGNELVAGAGLGGGPWQPEGIVDGLALELFDRSTGFELDEEITGRTIDRWVTNLRRAEDVVTVLATLSDFVADESPIEVGDGIVLDELTSEEISAALRLGAWSVGAFESAPMHSGFAPTTMVRRVFGVRTSYAVPIVVGGGTDAQVAASLEAQAQAARSLEDVLLALRVFKGGRLGLQGVVILVSQPFGGLQPMSGTRIGQPGRLRVAPYALAASETAELRDFCKAFAAARANRLIDSVARRFGFAADRNRPDDEIVDLVIAAESLFFAEIGPPSERGELTFRLSTRAASFAGGDVAERLRLLSFMRRAYRARSSVVHSGELDESNLRDRHGDAVTAAAFADDLEELLRQALKKVVLLIASDARFPPDWDDLLFRPPVEDS